MFPLVIMLMPDNDNKAFMEQLYIDHYRLMISTARGFVTDPHVIGDIISDSCLALMNNVKTLRTLDYWELRGYIVSTVKSKVFDYFNRKKVQNEHFTSLNEIAFALPDKSIDIEKHIILNEELKLISAAINTLPAKERLVFLLSYKQGLDYKTIARIADLSEHSIHKYISRSREKIREIVYGKKNEHQ